MTIALAVLLVLAVFVYFFQQQKIFGKIPDPRLDAGIASSPNFKNGTFQNLSPTPVAPEGVSYVSMLKNFFNKPKDTVPATNIPAVKTKLDALPDDKPVIVWFGHSSYLIKYAGLTILVDPVFSGNASPFSFSIKAFPGSDIYTAADMPEIDMLIITHDHYDHLDYKTLIALKPKIKKIYTALGVSAHLKFWDFPKEKITVYDWWDSKMIQEGVQLTAAPARHFSGRKLSRGKTLWTSFILQLKDYRLYIGGDSGYDHHFKIIGEKYGPFDIALLECGQYNTDWPYIHMMPEEVVQAAKDLRAKSLMPVHWGKFSLALHPWNEPVKRLVKAAGITGMPLSIPMIGEPLVVGDQFVIRPWWLLEEL